MINHEVIEEYQRFRKKSKASNGVDPIKNRTINIEVTSLKTMFNKAIKWGLLHTNPLDNVEHLKTNDSIKVRPLGVEEVKILLQNIPRPYFLIFYTVIHTGLRESEIINLQWRDVDFKGKKIHIRAKTLDDGEQWTPKSSGKSSQRKRAVDIGDSLIKALKEYQEQYPKKRDDWVFYNSKGRKLIPGRLRKVLRLTTEKCGFPEVTQFHALRHTYATHLIRCGADIVTAQAELGHSDIRTTKKYADALLEQRRKAVGNLNFGDIPMNIGEEKKDKETKDR